ncbi:cystatin domain-containing protein [Asticcacaulis sp. 201]|uniref:cystatin domain-containing protein n=1 Tax=Asticcacaulis sp. 201 TaxID=3028787 RepID=UPI002916BB35|nr:cystatin domain-containing protein [Asticcacaulis sp. 201]MDV6332800.1 cystatin domain-containing protein [Asticcacaulis sp. 201]
MTSTFSSLFFLFLASATAGAAQTPAQPAPPIVGGFQAVDVKDADVQAAADFAIHNAPKPVSLKRILSARQQVVAGMNYSLCLRVKSPRPGLFTRGHLVSARVYKDLNAHYSLTAWTDVEVCD